MATLVNPKIVKKIIRAEGWDLDTQALSIHQYRNPGGKRLYYVQYPYDDPILETAFVIAPVLLWSTDRGLTFDGSQLIA